MKKIRNKGAKAQDLKSPHGPAQTLHRSEMDAYMAKRHNWYGKKNAPESPMMGMGMFMLKP